MDSVHCNWNGAKADQISTRSRPMSETLSKLAQLITCMEYKPKPQTSSSIRKNIGHKFSERKTLARHQESEHALRKLHRCQRCGQKFALLSTLKLHKCQMCQTCRGKHSGSSSCPSCGREPSRRPEDPLRQDNSPYACAPCGQAFSHKQELLQHQQAGGCQPRKTLKPPPPSYSSSPPSTPSASASLSTCSLCSRTFRTSAGLSCHMRFSPAHTKRSKTTTFSCRSCDKSFHKLSLLHRHRKEEHRRRTKKNVLFSSMLFQCRSCEKSFPKTSQLHRHRREEHRRDLNENAVRKENSEKATRKKRRREIYPCSHCGEEFPHHLTRWAHFKHCAPQHQSQVKSSGTDSAGFDSKAAKDLRSSLENRPKRGRPRTKNPPALIETEQKDEVERNEEDENEDDEYPCTSCDQVFSSKSALHVHEEIHEEVPEAVQRLADACRCCSVCAGGIPFSEIPEDCERKVYHCVPCAEAFVDLDAFLEHCQKHLLRENQDELSDD